MPSLIPVVGLLLAVGGGILYAQLEGSDRGIPPVDSASNFEILGVEVDVAAANAEAARVEGWRRAQALGWRMLWARTHRRPPSQAPNLPESVLSGIVSGIIIEQEQIGPTRYIARLGVLFDRARTGQLLGVSGLATRSAPLLLIPVMRTGSAAYSFEYRNEWQRAWAQYPHRQQPDRLCPPVGLGHRSPGAEPRPGAAGAGAAGGGCCSTNMAPPTSSSPRSSCGGSIRAGPAVGIFTARYGPDISISAASRCARRAAPRLPRDARRRRAAAGRALSPGRSNRGCCRPDPTLVIIAPPLPPILEEVAEDPLAEETGPALPTVPTISVNIQVATPDAGSVQQAEVSVSRVDGVTSAITTSLALGGTSVMRVTYRRRRRRASRRRCARRAGRCRWSMATL